jgi:hypothetical protein
VANTKTIGGAVVNTAGVALVSKTVTLKNDDTGAVLTTTTTNADGEWEFANRDETIRYRADAAFGGSSSQVVVRKPASAEFDHLYANLSFRSASAATVAFGGALTAGGDITSSALLRSTANAAGVRLRESDAALDSKVWDLTTSAGSLVLRLLDDAEGAAGGNAITVNRTGTTLSGVQFLSGATPVVAIGLTTPGLTVAGELTQGGNYAYLGGYNTAGTDYPTVGSHLAVGFNFNSGGRDIAFFNTDATPATVAFTWRQLTGAATQTELLRLNATGQLLHLDGTLALPGMSFLNDPDTGPYRIGANNLAVALGGVKVLDLGGAAATTDHFTTATNKVPVRISGIAAQTADMFQIRNSANTLLFAVEANGQTDVLGPLNISGAVGFYGTAPIGGPNTVSGSRGGNAALASLLTTLANMGLFINTTTA